MESHDVGVVLAAPDLPAAGCGLEETMRQHARLSEIPVVALAASARDRESMLASIEQLAAAITPDRPVPQVSMENRA
jgi:hypothetical protein